MASTGLAASLGLARLNIALRLSSNAFLLPG